MNLDILLVPHRVTADMTYVIFTSKKRTNSEIISMSQKSSIIIKQVIILPWDEGIIKFIMVERADSWWSIDALWWRFNIGLCPRNSSHIVSLHVTNSIRSFLLFRKQFHEKEKKYTYNRVTESFAESTTIEESIINCVIVMGQAVEASNLDFVSLSILSLW